MDRLVDGARRRHVGSVGSEVREAAAVFQKLV